MKHLSYLLLALFIMAPAMAEDAAGEAATSKSTTVEKTPENEARFVLKDKSEVRGVILTYSNGVYEVQTEALGKVSIKADKIAAIDYLPIAAKETKPADTPASLSMGDTSARVDAFFGFEQILQTLMSDPAMLEKIQGLANDPQFQALADDPEIRKAIENGNIFSLAQNKKLWELMDHPTVKEITRTLSEGGSLQNQAE